MAGDVVRRSRGPYLNYSATRWEATRPHQFAMTTRAGCECIVHALQGLPELDFAATITSMDGVSAFDMISRRSMLEALRQLPGGGAALPFVRMFCGRTSEYFWEEDFGVVHRIAQGEGGEQGDALMPLLFSLGQHEALQQVHRFLNPGERFFAFLGDVHFLTKPDIRRPPGLVEVARRNSHSRRSDANLVCDVLERAARTVNPRAQRFGEDLTCQPTGKGSRFWALQWGTQISLPATSVRSWTIACCWTGFPTCRICSGWLILLHCAAARQ